MNLKHRAGQSQLRWSVPWIHPKTRKCNSWIHVQSLLNHQPDNYTSGIIELLNCSNIKSLRVSPRNSPATWCYLMGWAGEWGSSKSGPLTRSVPADSWILLEQFMGFNWTLIDCWSQPLTNILVIIIIIIIIIIIAIIAIIAIIVVINVWWNTNAFAIIYLFMTSPQPSGADWPEASSCQLHLSSNRKAPHLRWPVLCWILCAQVSPIKGPK